MMVHLLAAMHCATRTFALLSSAGAGDQDLLTLTVLPEALATFKGARCLDSSAAAYYSALGSGPDKRRWIVYLEGGGECESRKACEQRSQSPLGSSRSYKKDIDAFQAGGIMGRDPATNPFARWSVVYIPYCSGDDWLGTMNYTCDAWTAGSCDGPAGLGIATSGLFHAGHNIIDACLEHVDSTFGLGEASTILISGGSAGGQGAYYHADWLKLKYPKTQVLSAPEYGWFGEPFSTFADWSQGKETDPTIPYPSPASKASAPGWPLHITKQS